MSLRVRMPGARSLTARKFAPSAKARPMLSRAAGRLWWRLTEATRVATSFIPVLCYHSISDEPYAISPARFAAQMRWLRGHGYRSVGLERVILSQPTERAVAITFDDGLADLEHNALPALAACSFRATVFFCPELAGATMFYSPATGLRAEAGGAEKRLDFMSWDQVERMAAAGVSFQSHGMSHARLTALDDAALAAELRRPRRALEDRLGAAVQFLSYPFGDFDERVQQAAAAAGYRAALTTIAGFNGPARNPYALRRIASNPGDDLCAFAFKLSPAAAWYYRRRRSAGCAG